MGHRLSRRRLIAATMIGSPVALGVRDATASAAPPPGVLKTLSQPVRVFDSREPSSVLAGERFRPGNIVAVTVSGAYEGDDLATAVFVNVTITQTEGAGFLAICADDLSGLAPPPTTSNINWSTNGITLANLALSAVGGEHAIAVHCGGTSTARTHVIVDVQGYVPFVV
jgi:hypothetical protein